MKTFHWLLSIIFLATLSWAHFVSRTDFNLLFTLYTIAFSCYFMLVFGKASVPLKIGLALALLCRMAGFFAEPLLSDDYYRFVWDGYVMHSGLNPAAFTPAEINAVISSSEANHLYSLLNSPHYFSVYPPVLQLIYYASFFMNGFNLGSHIIFYKIILLCADGIIIFLLLKILKRIKRPGHHVLIYALNPLIVIEYMGNLHMDTIMIAFLLTALLFIVKGNLFAGSLMMALSISTKMLSLILLPFLPLKKFSKEFFILPVLTLVFVAGFFWIFFQSQAGWLESIALWFRQFEFNASIYYLAQLLYASFKGYEDIRFVGPMMACINILGLIFIWLWSINRNIHWSVAMTFCLSFYFLLSTTVHPWYLGMLLTVTVMSGFIFPVIWTYVAFLSYSHYNGGAFSENYILISTEYTLLFLFTIFEFKVRGLNLLKPGSYHLLQQPFGMKKPLM